VARSGSACPSCANILSGLDQPDPPALCFRTHQDALDFADHLVQEADWLLAIYNFGGVLQNYREGNFCICATLSVGPEARKIDLICRSVVGGAADEDRDSCGDGGREAHFDLADPNGHKAGMLGRIAKLIDTPEGVIPSFVSLQPFKVHKNFRVQVFKASYFDGPMSGIGSERKVAEFGIWSFIGHAGSVARLVQAGPQVINCIENDAWKAPFERIIAELDLMKLVSGVQIAIDIVEPTFFPPERGEFGIKVVDVILCTTERAFSALKQVTHGDKTRSNKSPGISESDQAFSHDATAAA
jgi:hypothetical protein